jgi:hypothetical protein
MGTAIITLNEDSSLSDFNYENPYRSLTPTLPNEETDIPTEGPSQYIESNPISSLRYQRATKYEGIISETETIEQWWKGEIIDIQQEEGFFSAYLVDLEGNTCIAEFDIDKVFDKKEDININLYPHAKFAFYVVTKHGRGTPRTETGLEFSVPYIWRETDNEVLSTLLNQYFQEDT